MRLLKQLVPVALVAFAGGAIVGAVQGNSFFTLLLGLATAVLAVLVYARVVRWSERREPVEVARQGATRALTRGTLIGVALFAAVIVNIALVGGYRIDGLGSLTGAIGLIGFMAAAAVRPLRSPDDRPTAGHGPVAAV